MQATLTPAGTPATPPSSRRAMTVIKALLILSALAIVGGAVWYVAITGIIGSLAGYAAYELCTGVLECVFEINLLGYADTVFGDAGSAEFLLDYYIAAFRTEGYLYSIGEGIGSGMELFACLNVIFDDFCHDCLWIEYPLLYV